jgi:hypothetical protein
VLSVLLDNLVVLGQQDLAVQMELQVHQEVLDLLEPQELWVLLEIQDQ